MIKVQVPCIKDVNTGAIFRHRRKFADARQSNAEEEANPNVSASWQTKLNMVKISMLTPKSGRQMCPTATNALDELF